MSIRSKRKLADTIPILLKCVAAHISRTTEESTRGSLQKIENELKEMVKFFPKLKLCEEVLLSEFNVLERDIDDDDLTTTDEIGEKLESIQKRLDQIKSIVTKIQLPALEETPTQSQQQALSENQSRKVSEDWSKLSVEKNILVSPAMANLQLSYDALDYKSKLCLLCLAVFPEKAVIKKRPLIYWWIAEGFFFVKKSSPKTAQEVGEGIFNMLIEKSLILPVYKKEKNHIVDSCTMHPWIRRMLILLASRAEFLDFDGTRICWKSRRACLVSSKEIFPSNTNPQEDGNELVTVLNVNAQYLNFKHDLFLKLKKFVILQLGRCKEIFSSNTNSKEDGNELVTVLNVNAQYLNFKHDLFLKLKKLVILQLGRWQASARHHIEVEEEEFMNELGALKHLKYLNFQGISRITALHPSIVECINLEILDLRACHNLESLPSDISSLRKLTHLDVSECYLLESMPKGLEKLSSLQVLKGFVIGYSGKNPCKLGDLVQLTQLRKLGIHIRGEAVIEEGELKKVNEIQSLRVLTISWGVAAIKSKSDEQATWTVKPFSFPLKLEKLDLRCIPMSPDWLKPSNFRSLKKLYVRGGQLVNFVQEPGAKWEVQILRLKYLKNLQITASQLQENFPRLSFFEKVPCQNDKTKYENDVQWEETDGWESLESKLSSN